LETITINTSEGRSQILTGIDWKSVTRFIPSSGTVIITDENVKRLYGDSFPDCQVITIEAGEKSKSLVTIAGIVEDLLKAGLDREGFILGIGGGVVCDIAGFTASVYMRGVRFGFVSTTLLSQVDASTGGKNGVNSKTAKNIIGVFNNPEFVICDPEMLSTLPDEEYRSGLSELVKAALIQDEELLGQIEENFDKIRARDKATLQLLITRAVKIKAAIVVNDMHEAGERRLLNFGHTLGHAAEIEYGILHGQAVAWGMVKAMEFSAAKGHLSNEDFTRVVSLFRQLNLLPEVIIDNEIVAGRMVYDKKRSGSDLNFVFLERPGSAFTARVGIDELTRFIMKKNE
jgi:3-dehydroquinate synthase